MQAKISRIMDQQNKHATNLFLKVIYFDRSINQARVDLVALVHHHLGSSEISFSGP